jgi:hypothetical protein
MAKRRNNSSRTLSRSRGKAPSAGPRIGDLEKGFYIVVVSFAVALSALLAHGASSPSVERTVVVHERLNAAGRSPVYGKAMFLAGKYDSRPYWKMAKLTPGVPTSHETADLAIEHLIPCESGGRTVDHLDSNGKMSYGILQFQDWEEWERMSGITGNPENSDDAIRMAEWGIEHGMIDHWGCSQILGMR